MKPLDDEYQRMENALTQYSQGYIDYVQQQCRDVSPNTAEKLRDSVAVHQKVDSILRKIQNYRIAE